MPVKVRRGYLVEWVTEDGEVTGRDAGVTLEELRRRWMDARPGPENGTLGDIAKVLEAIEVETVMQQLQRAGYRVPRGSVRVCADGFVVEFGADVELRLSGTLATLTTLFGSLIVPVPEGVGADEAASRVLAVLSELGHAVPRRATYETGPADCAWEMV